MRRIGRETDENVKMRPLAGYPLDEYVFIT